MNYKYFLRGKHFQTIIPSLFRPSPDPGYERVELTTRDDDFLDLDTVISGKSKCMLFLHGMEGSSYQHYITNFIPHIQDEYDIVAMNFRSCSGRMNRGARLYHSGDTQDIEDVLLSLKGKYEEIHAIGFSMGGNVILKYMGEKGDDSLIDNAVAISSPVDLTDSAKRLARGFSLVYTRHLMQPVIKKWEHVLKHHKFDIDFSGMYKCHTFYAFDNIVTAPVSGFRDADHYYTDSSAKKYFYGITKKATLINAKNDPFLGEACYPNEPSHINFIYPELGGHVGFFEWGVNQSSKFEKSVLQSLRNA